MRIPPEIISEFDLRVRRVVDGVLVGRAASSRFGGSPEFAEHVAYNPGDDVRRIDWKVYARKKKLFLKRFFHESEIPLVLLYDRTKSMAYQNKAAMASLFAGAFAYISYRMHGSTAMFQIGGGAIPFSRGFSTVLRIFYEASRSPSSSSSFGESVLLLLSQIRKRSLVIVISDMAFPEEDLLTGISLLCKKHETAFLHVLSSGEWNFREDGKILIDMETGESVSVPPDSRSLQRDRIRAWVRAVRSAVLSRGGAYSLVFSDEEFRAALRRTVEAFFPR